MNQETMHNYERGNAGPGFEKVELGPFAYPVTAGNNPIDATIEKPPEMSIGDQHSAIEQE